MLLPAGSLSVHSSFLDFLGTSMLPRKGIIGIALETGLIFRI